MNYIRNTTDQHSPQPAPFLQPDSEAVAATNGQLPTATPQEPVPLEPAAEPGASDGPRTVEAPSESYAELTPATRLKRRLSPKVLFRLELSLDQAARIRTILNRCSKDLPFAESQIRGLLSEEQNREWESIAP
jgi:hypothetical protein